MRDEIERAVREGLNGHIRYSLDRDAAVAAIVERVLPLLVACRERARAAGARSEAEFPNRG